MDSKRKGLFDNGDDVTAVPLYRARQQLDALGERLQRHQWTQPWRCVVQHYDPLHVRCTETITGCYLASALSVFGP